MKNFRIVHTNLYGAQAKVVIDSVHGQLSDGKWENTPGYDKYWTNFDVQTADDGEVIFKVNADGATTWCKSFMPNPFYHMSDAEFKKWIAKKIKAVVNDERKDRVEFGAWDRRNIDHTTLYLGKYDETIRDITTTVADVYCTYEALLDHTVIAKFNPSTLCRVYGSKKSDEETPKAKSYREALEAINAKYKKLYSDHRAELETAKHDAIRRIEDDFSLKLASLKALEKTEISSLNHEYQIA